MSSYESSHAGDDRAGHAPGERGTGLPSRPPVISERRSDPSATVRANTTTAIESGVRPGVAGETRQPAGAVRDAARPQREHGHDRSGGGLDGARPGSFGERSEGDLHESFDGGFATGSAESVGHLHGGAIGAGDLDADAAVARRSNDPRELVDEVLVEADSTPATGAVPAVRSTPRRLPLAVGEKSVAKLGRRALATRLSQPMLHRRPTADCPLCPVSGILFEPTRRRTHGLQHMDAEKLWRAYTPGRSVTTAVRAGRVVEAARELGIAVTAAQVVVHYRDHKPEQPAFTGTDTEGLRLHAQVQLSQRERTLLLALSRRRVMTTAQIVEVLYGDLGPAYAVRQARRDLGYLTHQGFVYRYFVDASDRRAVTPKTTDPERMKHVTKKTRGEQMRDGLGQQAANMPFYFLGKAAVPFVELMTGATLYEGDHFFQSAAQIGQASLPHDVRANELYVAMLRSLRARGGAVRVGDGVQTVRVLDDRGLPSNWHGPRTLPLFYYDKTVLDYDEIRPDGFAVLDLPRAADVTGGPPATQLPFFVEFDRGSRKLPEVRQQLLAYHRAAIAGAAGRRFPQLAVEGYAVPILMVFSDRARMEGARRHLRRDAERAGLAQGGRGVPVMLAVESEWLADPFAAGIIRDGWDPDAPAGDFLRMLGNASRRLVASSTERRLIPGRPLRVDPLGAKPKGRGYYDADRRTTARERDAEAKAKRKRIDATNAAMRERYGVAL